MLTRTLAIAAIATSFAACTQQPPPRGPLLIEQPANPASLRSSLSDLGFTLADTASGLPARLTLEADDPRANCRTILIRDNFGERSSRGRFVDADQVITQAAETSEGELRLSAHGRYLNRYDNRRTSGACEISPSFEAEIKNALK